MHLRMVGIACAMVAGGCATGGFGNNYLSETSDVDFAGPFQILDRGTFEPIGLVRLLDPEGKAATAVGDGWSKLTPGEQIDRAIFQFYENTKSESTETRQARRNRVQDRLMAASTQRCGAYKGNLQRTFSRTNFGLGLATTIAGIAGALVPGAQASKNLSGISGIFGGARAEFNQDYYANLTVNVIVDGIELRQQEVVRQIMTQGQNKSLELYSVEAAIKDAIFFHNQCTLVSGLQAASESIKFTADPGIDGATRIMIKAQNLRRIAEGKAPDAAAPDTIEKLGLTGRLYAGTLLQAGGDAGSVLGVVFENQKRAQVVVDEFKARLSGQKGGFEDAGASDKIVKAAEDGGKLVAENIKSSCEEPAKDLMAKLAQKQAELPLTTPDIAAASLRSEIRNLNTKAGYVTAAVRRQLEDLAYALGAAAAKLGAADKKVATADSNAALSEVKKVAKIEKLCAI